MAIKITSAEKAILQNVTIPPRPEALIKVSEEAKKPEPDISIIAEAISHDVGISAAVLQVVNSAAFRRTREIESIDQAVMVLGLKRVFPIVKAVAVKASMAQTPVLDDFWQSSDKIAQACSIVSRELEKPQLADNAYMLGLFHNAGIPVMLQYDEAYAAIIQSAKVDGWDFEMIEKERDQFDTAHTTVGALLAQQWKLAKDLVEVIYYQHDTNGIFLSDELSKVGLWILAILKIARHVALDRLNGEDSSVEWEAVRDQILQFCKLEDDELTYILERVEQEIS
ncbi:HDOD domain-containing protein [Catenovulum sp. SM1970]|uniref:HDOD domain-containing protein n=1 Tax=Marinifaba aquimaris TaxID=2741323 RepID=UPI001573A8AE|nr:HDOD domain-containing protein [Marinifaba aquimaris]NTS77127.1 HDOD domain-containing protein [Marinifaba aquimaris]